MSRIRVDLNGDVGESFGAYVMGADSVLMPWLTSASVACGFHAGDPAVMRGTVALATAHGVAVGAHPGFPDLAGFGRRDIRMTPRDVEDLVIYQIGALSAFAAAEGVTLQHVKAHGALYTMAVVDRALADAIARATRAVDPALVLVGLSGSAQIDAGRAAGLETACEVFADRAYEPNGTLVPRHRAGAVIHDEAAVVARALRIVQDRCVEASDGSLVRLEVDTLCVHGDTPGAAQIARGLRTALEGAGIEVTALKAR